MTQRVFFDKGGGLPERWGAVDANTAAPDLNVTADVVDRAVDEVFSDTGVAPDVARVMRNLMSADSGSAVAKAYYSGKVGLAKPQATVGLAKRRVVVPYVVSEAQSTALAKYAPDCALQFLSQELHDHPAAAACRAVDRAVVESRLPPGITVSHIGGAVLPLVLSGRLGRGHHACVPVVDAKDPARHVTVNLRLRKLASDSTRSVEVRDSARGYLDSRLPYMCGSKVQDCTYSTRVLTAVHVYDIPMVDWAGIMDNKGADLCEGCVLFPQGLFEKPAGEVAVACARYEVDAVKDVFRMGFIDSPSWWYEHKFSEFVRYGVDQVLCAGKRTYSYKVVERRGDTLFFRILAVSNGTLPDYRQVYRVPGVEMVNVDGFPVLSRPSSWHGLERKKYMFPRVLWEDMLKHAKSLVQRGTLTHERLANYYRTVAPRQSINAVVVSGGTTVEKLSDLVPLIAHVALFAFLETYLADTESRAVVGSALRDRARQDETLVWKLMAAFGEVMFSALKLTIAPFVMAVKAVSQSLARLHESMGYSWRVEPAVRLVSAKLLLPRLFSGPEEVVCGFEGAYAASAPVDAVRAAVADPGVAAVAADVFADVLSEADLAGLREAAKPAEVDGVGGRPGSASLVPTTGAGGSSVVGTASTVQTLDVSPSEVDRRRSAVREAMVECELEARQSEAACADQFRELVSGGSPNRRKVLTYKETFNNPEFWYVDLGVITGSFSGAPVDGFVHSAVYCPVVVAGERLCQVVEQEYKGMSQGDYVERVHYTIGRPDYTGWVYTNDSLLVHNGPAVYQALEAAIELPMDFAVVLNQGPPGCGKTSAIVRRAEPGDFVLVPARKAARETADRLRGKGEAYEQLAKERCRTLDSYLVNRSRNKRLRDATALRLLADEAFMTREGRWLAAAAFLGVSVVEAFGDEEQIPHVPRVECPAHFVKISYSCRDTTWLSYRCPPQLVACWGGVYGWRVRSASPVQGEVAHVVSTAGRAVPSGCVMMGMYQADKKVLQEKYANCGVPVQVMTVHESQGNTYKHVWLHRFDNRKRTDKFSLYDRQEYALVAMSRSTHSFVYVAPRLGDLVQSLVEFGRDVRRVSAAADVSSAGEVKEFG